MNLVAAHMMHTDEAAQLVALTNDLSRIIRNHRHGLARLLVSNGCPVVDVETLLDAQLDLWVAAAEEGCALGLLEGQMK